MENISENISNDAMFPSGGDAARTLTVTYLGNILAQDYEVELSLNARQRGLVMEATGAILQRRPQELYLPLIPVALQLPDILGAWIAVPDPFRGTIHVRLELKGLEVRGEGAIALTLPTSAQPIPLFRFQGAIGSMR